MRTPPPAPVSSQAVSSGDTAKPDIDTSPAVAKSDNVLPGLQQESSSLFGSPQVRNEAAPETPGPSAAPKPQLAPSIPWSTGERTIDFGDPDDSPDDSSGNVPADQSKAPTTLETAPFRPGGTPPAVVPSQSTPFVQSPPPEPEPQPEPEPPPQPQQTLHPKPSPVVPSGTVPLQDSGMTGQLQRARRLARVLVSDIVVYNQEVRDKEIADGNLVTVPAGEVNKAWELYKNKVEAGILEESDFFKDALNEILADGRKVY